MGKADGLAAYQWEGGRGVGEGKGGGRRGWERGEEEVGEGGGRGGRGGGKSNNTPFSFMLQKLGISPA